MELLALYITAACALLAGGALVRQRQACARLQRALDAACEAQRTQDSLLLQRSQLDTIKDEFISTVSHELRTPLTSIRGALGLLSGGLIGTMDAKAQNLLRIASTNTDRLIRLINDILDLERMQSGRAPLYTRRCSLGEIALQATEAMKSMADTAGVRLELLVAQPHAAPQSQGALRSQAAQGGQPAPAADSSSDAHLENVPDNLPDLSFDGDPDRIHQVLINLISNAVKFSPPNSTVQIEIDPGTDGTLQLRVRDQGRGIPADKLNTIFDRFGQVEASDARQKGGTGLGLAICRSIVQQHNGTIWAESNGPASTPGACLVFSLPRLARHEQAAMDETDPLLLSVAEGIILVCDDEEAIRTVIAENLRRRGYAVVELASGEEAIARAAQGGISAILLDLHMPGLNGWETLQRLKTGASTSRIPVVILSVLPPRRRSGERQGDVIPEGWVTKPLNETALLSELTRVLHVGEGPARILLVEDDNDLADVIVTGFNDEQVRVNHASTYSQAVLHCRLSRPDLLILDLSLPDGDGFSLVDWLRKQPELKTLPLVVYSGREVSDREMTQLRLGPTQFLTKAKVQPEEVEELVFKMVQTLRFPQDSAVPVVLDS